MTGPAGSPGRVAQAGRHLAAAEARLLGAQARRSLRWIAAATTLGAAAATVGIAATGCLVAAVVLGLATTMPAWLAALVTAGVLLLVSVFLAILAREAAKDAAGALRETGERAREEARWMGTLISSNGR